MGYYNVFEKVKSRELDPRGEDDVKGPSVGTTNILVQPIPILSGIRSRWKVDFYAVPEFRAIQNESSPASGNLAKGQNDIVLLRWRIRDGFVDKPEAILEYFEQNLSRDVANLSLSSKCVKNKTRI